MFIRIISLFLSFLAITSLVAQEEVRLIKQNGDYYFESGNYHDALNQYERGLMICDSSSTSLIVDLLVGKGRSLQLQEKYDLAFLALEEAVELSSTGNPEIEDARVSALVYFAEFHRNGGNFMESRRLIDVCTEFIKGKNINKRNRANYYNRFAAIVNEYNHNSDSVILLSEQALALAEELNDDNLRATSINEIAHVEEHYGDLNKAILGYREAADIWTGNSNFRSTGTALYNLGRVYNKAGQHSEAVRVVDEGITLVESDGWYSILVDLYAVKTLALFAMKDFESGSIAQAKYYDATIELKERENNLGMTRIKNELEIRRKNEKIYTIIKNNRMVQLQLKSQRIRFRISKEYRRNLKYVLVVSAFLLVLLFLLFFRAARVNRKLKWLVESRQLLLKEVHHRVKNNMQTVSSLLELQTMFVKDPAALNAIQTGKDRINSLALAHQKLYLNNKYDSIDLKQYIESIAKSVIPDDVEFELYMEDLEFEIEKAQSVGFVINELMMNSIKHAWPKGGEDKNISITLRKCDDETEKTWCLEYQDTGVGVKDEKRFRKSHTFGVTIINTFLKRNLKGSYYFGDSSGFHLCIQFN
ncbi:MAG: tetratricopeptide repeat protein [Crocinitomicaceae bacterium]|nr:tetratricopeptide repeat protein [Crocinitomicaceae bacterium]